MKRLVAAAAVVWLGIVASAQQRTLRLPATPYRYTLADMPAHFRAAERADNTPGDNPITDAGATLGRVLFYDTQLSANNTTSCASCHVQKHAFADPNRFSTGFAGTLTDRHAMNLTDARYYVRARFFWDERAGNLEDVVLRPVENRVEMGESIARLPQKLAARAYYPDLFRSAFGDSQITEARIAKALAQFVRSLVSYQSRYDEGRARAASANDEFDNFTRQENRGKALFLRHCSACHMPIQDAHFFIIRPSTNGIDPFGTESDGGLGDITLNRAERGRFKSPTLRNVEVAGPYMHDGRLATLEAVIDHYSREFTLRKRPLDFTDTEKAALVAFLKTLTDQKFLTDPKFSDPWTPDAVARKPAAVGPLSRPPGAVVDDVVARVLSYDADRNGLVTKDELIDRMHPLIARGDANRDGALDASEIAAIAAADSAVLLPRFEIGQRRPPLVAGIQGVISDLMLPEPRRQAALAAMSVTQDEGELKKQMQALLTSEEFADFTAAYDRQPRAPGSKP